MSRSLLRFGQVLMLLVLFVASGGHWMVLQSVAWTRMLVSSYSQDGNFATAVSKTFDGRHPCALCQKIGQANHGDSQAWRGMEVEQSATFLVPVEVPMVRNDGISWRLEIPTWRGAVRGEQPVAPPPRSARA